MIQIKLVLDVFICYHCVLIYGKSTRVRPYMEKSLFINPISISISLKWPILALFSSLRKATYQPLIHTKKKTKSKEQTVEFRFFKSERIIFTIYLYIYIYIHVFLYIGRVTSSAQPFWSRKARRQVENFNKEGRASSRCQRRSTNACVMSVIRAVKPIRRENLARRLLQS